MKNALRSKDSLGTALKIINQQDAVINSYKKDSAVSYLLLKKSDDLYNESRGIRLNLNEQVANLTTQNGKCLDNVAKKNTEIKRLKGKIRWISATAITIFSGMAYLLVKN